MSEDDLQLTPEELAKLQSLEAEVSADAQRRAKLRRILEAKRKLDAKKKAEAEAVKKAAEKAAAKPAMSDEDAEAMMRKLEAEAKVKVAAEAKARAEAEARAKAKRAAIAEAQAKKQQALVKRESAALDFEDDELEDLSEPKERKPSFFKRLFGRASATDAIELASEARQELDKPKEKGKKSLLWSGGLSLVLGPLGWMYAGSFREAVPAGAVYLGVATLVGKILPTFLLMPVAGVVLPVSALTGVVYAWQYNRKGKRVRLFGDGKKKPKQLEE